MPWDRPRSRLRLPAWFRRRGVWSTAGLILLALLLAGAAAGFVAHRHFVALAQRFDMNQLGEMDSASTIFDRRNHVFGHIFVQNREPVSLAEVSVEMQHAVLAAEDARFYSHSGSDPVGIARALLKNLRSTRIRQGASTITQQLARNTFPLHERTLGRKILEIYVAHRVETSLTKDQILEHYLNRIYFGNGLYGVEAAAKGYFGKPAKELGLGESAMLAGLIKSPNNLSPWKNRRGAENARNFVLGRMVEEKFLNRAQAEAALAEPLTFQPRSFASADSYAVESIRQQVVSLIGFDEAVSNGYRIYATIDADLQRAAEEALRQQLDQTEQSAGFRSVRHQTYAEYQEIFQERQKQLLAAATAAAAGAAPPEPQTVKAADAKARKELSDPTYLQGALLAVDNSDGGVVAVVGGRDYRHSEYNRALSPTARRVMGTAFTPLVYAAAYQKGIFPGTLYLDQVIDNRQVMIGGETGILGEWGVERRDNQYEGPIPATLALVKGKNAATVRIGNDVGVGDVVALAKRAGINSQIREYPSTFLGSSEVTLSELTMAYTGFPNGGWRPAAPYLITRIEDNDGNVVYRHKSAARVRIVDEGPAYQVHNALAECLRTGTGAPATKRFGLKPTEVGGKPGTSYNFTDAVFCGYDGELTCGVWVGFDAPRTPIYRGAFGSELALPVWTKFMNAAVAVHPAKPLRQPPGLKPMLLCGVSGEIATPECFDVVNGERRPTTYTEYGTPGQQPKRYCLVHSAVGNGSHALAWLNFSRAHARGVTQEGNKAAPPKAVNAVDLTQFQAIPLKAPTVVNDPNDPYGAVSAAPPPVATAVAVGVANGAGVPPPVVAGVPVAAGAVGATAGAGAPETNGKTADPEVREIRRASAVSPVEQEVNVRRAIPVEKPAPLEFN